MVTADFQFQIIVSLYRWPDELDFDAWTVWRLEGTDDGPDEVVVKRLSVLTADGDKEVQL